MVSTGGIVISVILIVIILIATIILFFMARGNMKSYIKCATEESPNCLATTCKVRNETCRGFSWRCADSDHVYCSYAQYQKVKILPEEKGIIVCNSGDIPCRTSK